MTNPLEHIRVVEKYVNKQPGTFAGYKALESLHALKEWVEEQLTTTKGDVLMNTTNVFEGKPDERQADTKIAVSRFRPKYRALDPEEKALHDNIKAKAEELETLFSQVPAGRYASLAFTSLEESVMWIIKQLTA